MIKIAVIGTGGMANQHAKHFKEIQGCTLVAACDVDSERVAAFAQEYSIKETFTDLDKMLSSVDIDAVTNVTPDRFHASISLQCIEAGKDILCEKPLAENHGDAQAMVQAAEKKGVINMVNLSYRNSSALQKAAEIVKAGEIGEVKHVESSYLQSWLSSKVWGDWRTTPAWLWRLSTAHGSKGVLGDVGVHIVDFASFPVGNIASLSCRLKTFPKAENDRIGEYTLDANDSAIISVEYENGALGTIHTTRWATGHKNSLFLKVFGEKGALRIDLADSDQKLHLCTGPCTDKAEWESIYCGETPTNYNRFVKSIQTRVNDQPDFARGAQVQKILDSCIASDEANQWVTIN